MMYAKLQHPFISNVYKRVWRGLQAQPAPSEKRDEVPLPQLRTAQGSSLPLKCHKCESRPARSVEDELLVEESPFQSIDG